MGLVWGDWGPVAEVRKGGRESTVDVKPGTRRTTIFCMHCVFCRPMSSNGMTPARWREIWRTRPRTSKWQVFIFRNEKYGRRRTLMRTGSLELDNFRIRVKNRGQGACVVSERVNSLNAKGMHPDGAYIRGRCHLHPVPCFSFLHFTLAIRMSEILFFTFLAIELD